MVRRPPAVLCNAAHKSAHAGVCGLLSYRLQAPQCRLISSCLASSFTVGAAQGGGVGRATPHILRPRRTATAAAAAVRNRCCPLCTLFCSELEAQRSSSTATTSSSALSPHAFCRRRAGHRLRVRRAADGVRAAASQQRPRGVAPPIRGAVARATPGGRFPDPQGAGWPHRVGALAAAQSQEKIGV